MSFISERAIASERQAQLVRVVRVRELGSIHRTHYTVVSRRRVLSPLTQALLTYLRGAPVGNGAATRRRARRARRP